ncbi:probable LRR receptor-like serine/threonine-protein kinase At3g47570 [Lycium ferocissimum]|uniref:probable LRR receptor-like serine/threonine-protein kinase At3g47570 n=1 Tax=Lycium ferocissimum TaxID=112874 RepID=UPI00281692F7|nr:probable LRR receptor-like serine/threonine-protein kinase At3g47570 [Lycium ferocissimum]
MLSGAIPLSVFNLSSLYHLAAPVNQLKGTLPIDIGFTLPSLRLLYLFSNLLSGVLPSSIANLTNLEIISLSRNQMSGKIPSLENLHNLRGLGMHFNNLGTGREDDMDFFSSLANITRFKELSLSVNNIGGQLPKNIGNFSTNFRSIGFARNKLFGRIPDGFVNLSNMEIVSLEYNQLTGEIPASLGKLQKLKYFYVKANKLSGEIPYSVGNLTSLYGLNLAQNNIEGTIPSVLGNCQLLQMLYLSRNRLSGTIPKEVLSISALSIQLDLSGNQLSGSLPLEVGSLINLGYLDISDNKLSGKLPNTLGNCIKLENLYIQGNLFEGVIPQSVSSLRGLSYLDFSRNNFTGFIPNFFETFTSLKSLNLSFNNFEGEVPKGGVFSNASAAIISGNRNLCGGSSMLKLPLCKVPMPKKGRLSSTLKIIISVASGLFGITLVLVLLILCFLRRKRSPSPDLTDDSFLKISYGELLKATNGFSSENLIGKGGFGSVYKGIFSPDEKTMAIKVLDLQHRGALKSFKAECEVLKNLRHRNLVKLITACSGTDFQGNDFKALIYEFMVNGSLDEWLHSFTNDGSQHVRYLDLYQRINIAMDVAFTLEYLHHGSQIPVVHCDLKPSNVLLDEDMTARLGDFGLSRFLQETVQRETRTIGIKGSVGYAAPEYGIGSEVSTNGDIYSYGIMILEMLTGKKPTDDAFSNGLNLHNYVKMAFSTGRVMEIVDPLLCHNLQEEETSNSTIAQRKTKDYIKECLISMCKIGISCTMESPKERLGISDVVKELQLVKEALCKCDRVL